MSNIGVKVINQTAVLTNTEDIYSGDINTDTITFTFCDQWDGYVKTAIFYRAKDKTYQQLLNEDNTCIIPPEVLIEGAIINIGVYGVKDDQVLTSQIIRYRIKEGAICESIKIENPTLTIYAQIIAQYSEILANQGDFIESQTQTVNGFIESQNQTMNNFIESQNQTVNGFIESQNQTMSDYQTSWLQTVEDTRTEMVDEVNNLVEQAKVGDAETLNGHNSDYFAPKVDLANYLPLSGGTVEGMLRVENIGVMAEFKNTLEDNDFAIVKYTNAKYGELGCLGFMGENTPVFYRNDVGVFPLLHTRNKPRGTYTGNGNATSRTINTGGIGRTCAICNMGNQGDILIVSLYGAFGKVGGNVVAIGYNEIKFDDGILTISSANSAINANNSSYAYQVL